MTNPAPGDRLSSGILYRRIFPHPNYYDLAERRPTRQVFDRKKGDDHLSMALKGLATPEDVLRNHVGFGLCEIDVETLIREELVVSYEPTPEDSAHVAIRGRLSGGVRHRLACQARVVMEPTIEDQV